MTERSTQGSTRPRRGHQNHPKNMGIRSSNVPTSEIIQALRDGRNLETLFHQTTTTTTTLSTTTTTMNSQHEDNNNLMTETTCDENTSSSSNELMKAKRNSSSSSLNSTPSEKSEKKKHKNSELSNNKKKKKPKSSTEMTRMMKRSAADGAENVIEDDDEETAELAKLRCTSERMEVIAERENRRQKKCADYPGLAFARSIFSSDSMMKFNIIRNELQNIMNNQLRRVRDYKL
jgi:hypothetical protein